jgi:hypothetical protein
MLARKRAPRGHTPEVAAAFGAGEGLPTGTAHPKETVNG